MDQKYDNLKEELLENNLSNMEWNIIYFKSTQYLKTKHCKKTYKKPSGSYIKKYSLKKQQFINNSHLISIIIYCNIQRIKINLLKSYFPSINNYENESNDDLMERHSNFYWLSRILKNVLNVMVI